MEREQAYLGELTARLREVLGQELVGVYAGGSYALGGYVAGKSDLDVAVVVRERLGPDILGRLFQGVRHEALPCPARKLELVVYTAAAAGSKSTDADFELNLNTGEAEALRAETELRPGEGHWFAIDRSVLASNGIALLGPPAGEVFRSPERGELLPLLARVLRWYQEHEPESEDALLNAGRSLRFARDGVWIAKPAIQEWACQQSGTRAEILDRAIAELTRDPKSQVET